MRVIMNLSTEIRITAAYGSSPNTDHCAPGHEGHQTRVAHLTLRSTAAAQVHAYGDVGLRHGTLKVRGPTSKPSLLARVPLPASYRWPWRHSRSTSMTVFWLVVAVAAVVAVIWALKTF